MSFTLYFELDGYHLDLHVLTHSSPHDALPIYNAFDGTNLAMQVFGGHGFIKEWGVEQYVRDARINLIYEGTNTIQSLDLIGRKVLQDGGQKLGKFGKLVQDFIKANADKPEMKEFIEIGRAHV